MRTVQMRGPGLCPQHIRIRSFVHRDVPTRGSEGGRGPGVPNALTSGWRYGAWDAVVDGEAPRPTPP
ncbi:hypothetical protein GCM10010349_14950 [Streptomyces flavofungini]|nr:hypothetical protein GCM10010349_14950 [Streptomyces flavofungini]